MSTLTHRIIGVFAILLLVGLTAGCDRTSSDRDRQQRTEIGQTDQMDRMNEGAVSDDFAAEQSPPTPVGERPDEVDQPGDQLAENQPTTDPAADDQQIGQPSVDEQQLGDPMADDQRAAEQTDDDQLAGEQMADNTEPGAVVNIETLGETREDVADDLDIPVSAVVVSEQAQERFSTATDDTERKALLTVSTINTYMDQLDTTSFSDDDERGAFARLQADINTLDQNVQQYTTLQADQRDELKSRLDDNLDDVNDNFKKISKYIDFSRSTATGGGPLDEADEPTGVDQMDQRDIDNNPAPAGLPDEQEQTY